MRDSLYKFCVDLFPITRSITGDGVRKTLEYIKQNFAPPLEICEVPTGTECFDWEVPLEWNINDAYIITPAGNKICELKESNLHVVSYSEPVDKELSLEELQLHLHSLPEYPEAVPYVTSYYKRDWGFCLNQSQRDSLIKGTYRVVIDSSLKTGSLTYGEYKKKGKSENEVFLSTYVCHPSMANNELSGPSVVAHLIKWLEGFETNYSYRIVFIPETIGSLVYLSRHKDVMKKNIIAGFNVSCVGDNNNYSFMPSRLGNTLSDKALEKVMEDEIGDFKKFSFLERGSDERQYCSPGIDLPIASLMRTKYGQYKEYHTDQDNLDFISGEGLYGAFNILQKTVQILEKNSRPRSRILGEPQLGRRGLYSNLSIHEAGSKTTGRNICDFLSYCDGEHDLIDIAYRIRITLPKVLELYDLSMKHGLISTD